MDWRAAVIAGLTAGLVFLVASILVAMLVFGTTPWAVFRYLASLVMGQGVLTPAGFDAGIVITGLIVNFVLSIIYAVILAFIIHRWGLIVGIVGGALFGAALYLINMYALSMFFPWIFAIASTAVLVLNILWGAVAGGVYELLDEDLPRDIQQEARTV
jgi:hypothetical protein